MNDLQTQARNLVQKHLPCRRDEATTLVAALDEPRLALIAGASALGDDEAVAAEVCRLVGAANPHVLAEPLAVVCGEPVYAAEVVASPESAATTADHGTEPAAESAYRDEAPVLDPPAEDPPAEADASPEAKAE